MVKLNKYLNDKEWIYKRYIIDQKSTVEIAKEINVNPSSISRSLKRFNIKIRSLSSAAKKRKGKRKFKAEKLNNKEWLYQRYVVEKLTSYQIADIAKTNQRSVFAALKRHKIKSRDYSEASKLREYKSSFEHLNDKEWLYEHYIIKKLSSQQIGDIIGCSSFNVRQYLKKYNIDLRDKIEARKLIEPVSFKYDMLNNKEWLCQKYVTEKLSTIDITKLAGAKVANSARQSLIRYGIDVRNISDGLTCNREEDGFILNIPVIEGSLLGDAYLSIYNKESDISNPCFCKKNIGKDHIQYIYNHIFNKRVVKIKKETYHKFNDKRFKKDIYTSYFIRSLSHRELKSLYERWYPKWNNYKKVIPEDVDISPVSLLNWFMDDGNSYQRRKNSKVKQIVITLCSECFTKKNQQMIVDKINKEYKLNFKVVSYNSRWRIRLPQSQASLFYDIIGPCPVPSMEYKWK